jgi:DNA-binding beta-propeller fold protein YncE
MPSAAYADGYASDARFNNPHGIAFSANSMNFLICDTGNNVIRTVSLGGDAASATTTLTPGSQDGSAASFDAPWGIAVNLGGTAVYITDTNNNLVRLLQISSGIAS